MEYGDLYTAMENSLVQFKTLATTICGTSSSASGERTHDRMICDIAARDLEAHIAAFKSWCAANSPEPTETKYIRGMWYAMKMYCTIFDALCEMDFLESTAIYYASQVAPPIPEYEDESEGADSNVWRCAKCRQTPDGACETCMCMTCGERAWGPWGCGQCTHVHEV